MVTTLRLVAGEYSLPLDSSFSKISMIYFGCHQRVGHYAFMPGMVEVRHRDYPKLLKGVDGGYYPKNPELPNGVALLTHKDGKTILGFSDNTVDSRPGSHSTFVEDSILSFDEMVAKATTSFPEVFARFKFKVTQVEM